MEVINIYLNEKDKQALLSIAKCAHVREEHLLNIITVNRINTYIKQNLIVKEKCYNPKNVFTCYSLTEKGKRFIISNYNFRNLQHSQSAEHDVIIADKYFELTEDERKSWRTETGIKIILEKFSYMKEEDKEYSATDAFYVRENGEKIGFEVVTSNYTRAIIQAKKNCCELLGLKYEERRG